ncbi:MAG: IS21 family transposase [Candidatus Sericytochromatia bacterium]|nr:IS21 family transposase [Candidatus Sericytochromatia bacterium]
MTHPPERTAEILRLYHAERWPIGTIASQLGLHHGVVRRVLAREGVIFAPPAPWPSIADPYEPFIRELLAKYPRLRSSRVFEMVRERGYPGSESHLRKLVYQRGWRPKPLAEAYLRVRTLPGEQAQVDWAHFGHLTVGKARRPLVAFVMVLSYSRRLYLRFCLGQGMANFLAAHVAAFEAFGGVPRVLLYDNLKSAVLERLGDAIRFNPRLLEFAGHYRFEPRPVAVARGNEKGRVERAIQHVRHAFFAAREFQDLDDLNAQAAAWCLGPAAARACPEDKARSVAAVYEEEAPRLRPLPDVPFPCEERIAVQVGKTPYVRFDLNDYSVPHTHVRRTLTVAAGPAVVRVLDGPTVVATHPRSYGRAEQVEDPAHVADLIALKRAAREHRGMDRLHAATPSAKAFLAIVSERGLNLGAMVSALLALLERHGASELEAALAETTAAGVCHLPAIRQVLDRRRDERGLAPPSPVPLPDDPRVRDLVVTPHALARYDELVTTGEAQP